MEKVHLFNTSKVEYEKYLAHKPLLKTVKGKPQATDTYSANALEIMGIFGIYTIERNNKDKQSQ